MSNPDLHPITSAFVHSVGEMMLMVERELTKLVMAAREDEREQCALDVQEAGFAAAAARIRSGRETKR